VELPTPSARYLGPVDRGLLGGMRCSTGVWFENDVETFIQTSLDDYHDWRLRTPITQSSASSLTTSG
jgi:hypothetical protein